MAEKKKKIEKLNPVFEIFHLKQIKNEKDVSHLKTTTVNMPDVAADFLYPEIGNEDREILCVLCLNVKNEIIAFHRCHVGSLNASIIHPREIYKTAILNNASSIIIAHNHPSGNTAPSSEDIDVTKRIEHAGDILGIPLLDHLIIGDNQFLSLNEKGFL